jgi:hypothetical protein
MFGFENPFKNTASAEADGEDKKKKAKIGTVAAAGIASALSFGAASADNSDIDALFAPKEATKIEHIKQGDVQASYEEVTGQNETAEQAFNKQAAINAENHQKSVEAGHVAPNDLAQE